MPLAGARRAARQQALPHDPGPRPCGRRALRHPRRRTGPLQGKGRLPLVAEADHVGLITRMWYDLPPDDRAGVREVGMRSPTLTIGLMLATAAPATAHDWYTGL